MSSKKIKPKKPLTKTSLTNSKLSSVRKVALFILAIFVLSFNLMVKVDIKAENSNEAITLENLLKAHNEYRKSVGVSELKLNNLLNISSRYKGDVMIDNQCWSHYCPPGKSPWDFFDNASYDYVYAGENLAEGFYTIDTVMQAWINSKTHRDNIVKPEFTEVGFSILYGDYLNNSNNILIVTHFGSRGESDVLNAQNPNLEITSPEDGYSTSSEELEISGIVNGLDNVRVFNNNVLQGEAGISGGVFTYRIKALSKGNNLIWADGTNSNLTLNSNQISVNYSLLDESISDSDFELVSISEGDLSMSQHDKNLINLIFIIFLAVIFLIDILLVSRSSAINSKKSFSHYHLALILLVALVVLIGGFAGQIQNGISI